MSKKESQEVKEEVGKRDAAIVAQVLKALGCPPAFDHATVRVVDLYRYRVNILVRNEIQMERAVVSEKRISDSFFIELDHDQMIVDSNPPLFRKYS